MPAANISAYEHTQALIDLTQGIDISEPEVIDQRAAQVATEGAQEVLALEIQNYKLLKPSKVPEASAASVLTL